MTKREVQEFIKDHLYDDPAALMLKANQYPEWPMKEIVEQIQSKRKAKTKLQSWFEVEGIIYPPLLSMEQCSSEMTAKYKASLVPEGSSMADFTGGFGVDFAFLSQRFERSTYIERQSGLVELAKYNFEKLGLSGIELHHGESRELLSAQNTYDLIYLDPARRGGHNEKVVKLEDCEPDILELLPKLLAKAKRVILKTSPLLDIKGAITQLGCVEEVHVVSVSNEVKELVFILNKEATDEPKIHCINLRSKGNESFQFTFDEEEREVIGQAEVESYLYEPNTSILKAGAFKSVGTRYGLSKLHANSHLYTSPEQVSDFPGRAFKVVDSISLNRKVLKRYFPTMKANITVRNFPMTVAQIRKKSGLKEGGDLYLFGTTDLTGKRLLLCEKVDTEQEN
ncbi:hypothetical protein BFP97_13950 [Roseivirga sp. 4D4]|nr:hypothetical protein BFP97_13950 [Roseivirga sp. 4D4]